MPHHQSSAPAHPPLGANLVLIGYRAAGKTAVGELAARALTRPFVDLDRVLEEEAGQDIPALVAERGWAEFRRREKELVGRYGRVGGQVLATGGGVILDPENVEILRANGVVVWLQADPAAIRERLARNQGELEQRPSLTSRGTMDEVAEVLQERQPLYAAAAHVVIGTAGRSIPEVAAEVLAAFKKIGGER